MYTQKKQRAGESIHFTFILKAKIMFTLRGHSQGTSPGYGPDRWSGIARWNRCKKFKKMGVVKYERAAGN